MDSIQLNIDIDSSSVRYHPSIQTHKTVSILWGEKSIGSISSVCPLEDELVQTVKLYDYYDGLDDDIVPQDFAHIIDDDTCTFTIIKNYAFCQYSCVYLVSVIIGDNVRIVEPGAFYCCYSLKLNCLLSKTLEHIGGCAFLICNNFGGSDSSVDSQNDFLDCVSLRGVLVHSAVYY